MKKIISLMLMTVLSVCLTSCSKNEVNLGTFDYPLEDLFGTWKVTMIHVEGSAKWIVVDDYPEYSMSITFNSDGTYRGEGYLGNGSGTYSLHGKTITTYVDGKVYLTYTVKDLSSTSANVIISSGGENIELHVYKKGSYKL